jgi:hypothetical protein
LITYWVLWLLLNVVYSSSLTPGKVHRPCKGTNSSSTSLTWLAHMPLQLRGIYRLTLYGFKSRCNRQICRVSAATSFGAPRKMLRSHQKHCSLTFKACFKHPAPSSHQQSGMTA